MKLLTLLPRLVEFESLLARGYDALASRFAADPDNRPFFSRLAEEERTHVAKLEFLGRHATQRPEEFQEFEADMAAVRADLAELRDFVVRIPTVTLLKALTFVLRVEEGAAERHTRIARASSNQRLARVMQDLYVADSDHLGRIKQHLEMVRGRPRG